MADLAIPLNRPAFRFIAPRFTSTKDMFAGKGSLHASGRWMAKGTRRSVYTSLLPETALAEALAANRYYGFPDEQSAPLVFVTAAAKLKTVIDLRDGATRSRLRIGIETIVRTDWRKENRAADESITQAWGWAMHCAGVEGFLCNSAAQNRQANLIVFPENLGGKSSLKVTSEVEWPR